MTSASADENFDKNSDIEEKFEDSEDEISDFDEKCDENSDLVKKFEAAAEFFRLNLSSKSSPEELLYFYSLYKQAKEGPCNSPKPGVFDFQAKQKWTAWKNLGEMSKKNAMREYSKISNKYR